MANKQLNRLFFCSLKTVKILFSKKGQKNQDKVQVIREAEPH